MSESNFLRIYFNLWAEEDSSASGTATGKDVFPYPLIGTMEPACELTRRMANLTSVPSGRRRQASKIFRVRNIFLRNKSTRRKVTVNATPLANPRKLFLWRTGKPPDYLGALQGTYKNRHLPRHSLGSDRRRPMSNFSFGRGLSSSNLIRNSWSSTAAISQTQASGRGVEGPTIKALPHLFVRSLHVPLQQTARFESNGSRYRWQLRSW